MPSEYPGTSDGVACAGMPCVAEYDGACPAVDGTVGDAEVTPGGELYT